MAGLDDLKVHWIFHLKLSTPYTIAGGFFRDNLLGVPPKDIDIYIPSGGLEDFLEKIRSKIASIETITNEPHKDYKSLVEGGLPIHSVVKISTWVGEQLDVIVLAQSMALEDILKTFDFTVNQFGWQDGKILASTTGLQDLWNRNLRIYNDRKVPEERIKYFEAKGFTRSF